MSVLVRLYRVRGILIYAAVVVILGGTVLRPVLPEGPLRSAVALLPVAGILLFVVALVALLFASRILPERDTVTVASPVTGRWLGVNSPATKVPSHGVRAYGQAYAIDLVFEPVDAERPEFASGKAFRRSEEYPAFGEPVRAMVDGVVVTASDGQRDHLARSSWPAIAYMMVEGAVREIGGPRFIVGNHIVIRAADGVFALVAHVKQGSSLVKVGDTVRAGQVIAQCGNTGNSSEPHVHAQLMDRASLWTGQGIPFAFARVQIGEQPGLQDALPATDEHLTATV